MTSDSTAVGDNAVVQQPKAESTAGAYVEVNQQRTEQRQQTESRQDSIIGGHTNDAIQAFQTPGDGSTAAAMKSLTDAVGSANGNPAAIDKIAAGLNKANVGIIAERDNQGNLDVRYMGSREGVKIGGTGSTVDFNTGEVKSDVKVQGYKVSYLEGDKQNTDNKTLSRPSMETRGTWDDYKHQLEHDVRHMMSGPGKNTETTQNQIASALKDYAGASGMDAAYNLVGKINGEGRVGDYTNLKLKMGGTDASNMNVEFSKKHADAPAAQSERPPVRSALDKLVTAVGAAMPAGASAEGAASDKPVAKAVGAVVSVADTAFDAMKTLIGAGTSALERVAQATPERPAGDQGIMNSLASLAGVSPEGRPGLQKALSAAMEGRFDDLAQTLRGADNGKFFPHFQSEMNRAGMSVKVTGFGDISIAPLDGGRGVRMLARGWDAKDDRPNVYTFDSTRGGVQDNFKSADKAREQVVAQEIKARLAKRASM